MKDITFSKGYGMPRKLEIAVLNRYPGKEYKATNFFCCKPPNNGKLVILLPGGRLANFGGGGIVIGDPRHILFQI